MFPFDKIFDPEKHSKPEPGADLKRLASCPIFATMDDSDINAIIAEGITRERVFAAGETITAAGSLVDELGFVVSGCAGTVARSSEGTTEQTACSVYPAGKAFNVTNAAQGKPLEADIKALENCHILFIKHSREMQSKLSSRIWYAKLIANIAECDQG